MKILYLITRSEVGGSQTHLLDVMKGLRQDHQLILATGEEGFLTEEARQLRISCYVIRSLSQPLSPVKDALAFLAVSKLIKRLKPDLVHCHTSKAGVIGRLAAKANGIPAIFTAHTWSFTEGTSGLWKLIGVPSERLTACWTEKIITVSESNRLMALRKGVAPKEKLVTIHNGIEDSPWRAQPMRQHRPRVTMVARFAPQKNQIQLIEAAARLNTPFTLTFVGDGPTRHEAENCAQRLGLGDHVEFLGTRKDVDRVLADSQLFVLATNWEGFPMTILEAMRAGLPVIASNVDGVSEAVVQGQTGHLFARQDQTSLEGSLHRLLNDPAERVKLGQAGRRKFEAEFTQSAMIGKVSSVYEEVFCNHKLRSTAAPDAVSVS